MAHMEVDCSAAIDLAVAAADACVALGDSAGAVDALSVVEKQSRLGSDLTGNTRVLIAIADACRRTGDLDRMEVSLVSLGKKRGVVKEALAAVLQRIIGWAVALTPPVVANLDIRAASSEWGLTVDPAASQDSPAALRMLAIVRTISEGKIYVEAEHARATRFYAALLEDAGRTSDAADAMHGVAVETFGSVAKRERVSFQIDQMRLLLAVGHFAKATVASRKITTRTFEPASEYEDLRLRYLDLASVLALHDNKYMECSTHYLSMYHLPSVQQDRERANAALRHAVLLAVLAPQHGCEQSDRLQSLIRERPIDSGELPLYRDLLQTFLTPELVRWPLVEAAFGAELRSFPRIFGGGDGSESFPNHRWGDLRNRVIEHNVRTIASVYDCIRLARFAQLLDMDADTAEDTLCRLVSRESMLYARIDSPSGVISFAAPADAHSVLGAWDERVGSILTSLSKVSHQITKEVMVNSSAL